MENPLLLLCLPALCPQRPPGHMVTVDLTLQLSSQRTRKGTELENMLEKEIHKAMIIAWTCP
jgi:hypothetical protein